MKRVFSTGAMALAVGLQISLVGASWAMGKRPDYEEKTVYDPNRVQRGSPANPNSAFSPPRFDDTPFIDNSQKSDNASNKTNTQASSAKRRARQEKAAEAQAPAPVTVVPAPAPKPNELTKPAPLTVNSSEPPLPEEHIDGLDVSPSTTPTSH